MPEFQIGNRKIGPGHPVYVIAEMSANHQHDYEQAEQIVHAAREAGADAIKLQTYLPDTMTIDCDRDCFKIGKGTIWEGRGLHELYREAHTPWKWQPKLKQLAESLGMDCFSTPFDPSAVDFLAAMDVPAFKIASFELVDTPLLIAIARQEKPVILSTGMATLAEIGQAVETLTTHGADQIALLKCTSAYPARPEDMHLRTIPHLGQAFDVVAGLSDHTLGVAVPVAAVSLGAAIVEKHFTLSRDVSGPDSAFSLEPHEFAEMVTAIRTAQSALGHVSYGLKEQEQASRVFRRSLFVVKDVRAGEQLTNEHVRSIRPGHGLPPQFLDEVVGRFAATDIPRGTPLSWKDVA